MKAMLLDPEQGYGKQLLRYLVTDIRVEVGQLTLRGSVPRLEKAVAEMNVGTVSTVPTFIPDWRARDDSNVRPLPSEGSTLSN
jgi:site-specific DNA recombinase